MNPIIGLVAIHLTRNRYALLPIKNVGFYDFDAIPVG